MGNERVFASDETLPVLAAWVGHEFAVMATVFAQRCAANGLMNPQRLLLFQNFLVRGLAVASAGLFMVPEPTFAQDRAINFNNSVFGTSRLVPDAARKPLVGTLQFDVLANTGSTMALTPPRATKLSPGNSAASAAKPQPTPLSPG